MPAVGEVSMKNILIQIRVPVFLLGLAVLFFGVRYYSNTDTYLMFVGSAALLVLAAVAFTILLIVTLKPAGVEQSRAFYPSLLWKFVLILAMLAGMYYGKVMEDAAAVETFVQKVALAAWLSLSIVGLFFLVGVEMALKEFGVGANAEPKRIWAAARSWSLAGLLCASLLGINFSANRFDKTFDWSYLKVTSPSDATVRALEAYGKPVEAKLFFTRDNEVLPFVREYFFNLKSKYPQLTIEQLDKDLNPVVAEKHKVRANGEILLIASKEEVADKEKSPENTPEESDAINGENLQNPPESVEAKSKSVDKKIAIGDTIEKSRKNIAKLDELFRSTLASLVAKPQVAYFSVGHGEKYWFGEKDPLSSINLLYEHLRRQNYKVKRFGIQDGSMEKVPDDATFLAIIGPKGPFAAEEVAAIRNYVDGGGKLFLALDNDEDSEAMSTAQTPNPLLDLLQEWNFKYSPEVLADEQRYAKATGTLSDRWFIFTNTFTSHDSVRNLSKMDTRVAVLLFKSGSFEITKNDNNWTTAETIRSYPSTFVDLNKNYSFDKDSEKKEGSVLGLAIERKATKAAEKIKDKEKALDSKDAETDKTTRIIAVADAHMLSDVVLINSPGNQLFAVESLNWLAGTSELVGAEKSEEDVQIMLKRDEELLFYYGSLFAPPIIVMLIGAFVMSLVRRRSKRG
jgi:hypothetical protein